MMFETKLPDDKGRELKHADLSKQR
jgi:hypothetical protein